MKAQDEELMIEESESGFEGLSSIINISISIFIPNENCLTIRPSLLQYLALCLGKY